MSTPELKELLERVRKAEGPDPELDLAVHVALNPFPQSVTPRLPALTSSLDACLSLMGEVLPGWMRTVAQYEDGFQVGIFSPENRPANIGEWSIQQSEPLALLDCILQALLNQEARKEKTDG